MKEQRIRRITIAMDMAMVAVVTVTTVRLSAIFVDVGIIGANHVRAVLASIVVLGAAVADSISVLPERKVLFVRESRTTRASERIAIHASIAHDMRSINFYGHLIEATLRH